MTERQRTIRWGAWVPRPDLEGVFAGTLSVSEEDRAKGDRLRVVNHEGGHGFHGEGATYMEKKPKKAAGKTLDGEVLQAWPEALRG